MRQNLLVALLALCLIVVNTRVGYCSQSSAPTPPQTILNPHAEKIRRNVEKLGVGHKITVVVSDSPEYHGTISKIETESFQIDEVDKKQVVTIRYDETKKVYKDYYHKDPVIGRNPRKGLFMIIAITAFTAIGLGYGIAHRSN